MPAISSALSSFRQLLLLWSLQDPVQQVLGFRQFRGEAEEGLPLFPVVQLHGGLEQIPDGVQRFHTAGVYGQAALRQDVLDRFQVCRVLNHRSFPHNQFQPFRGAFRVKAPCRACQDDGPLIIIGFDPVAIDGQRRNR